MAELRLGENIVIPAIVVGGGEIKNQDKTITENGQYTADTGYTGLGTVTVAVPTGDIPSYVPPKEIVNGMLKNPDAATSYSTAPATDVDRYALAYAFYQHTKLISADLSSLTTVNSANAMYYCFSSCTNLTSADLPSLTTISGSQAMYYCFSDCINLTSVDLSSLTTISGSYAMASCFVRCRKLTELRFQSLQSFGTNTSTVNQFNNMLSGVTGCTLHFPSNMQSEVERRTGYPNFGGTNTVILFDLPPTNA